MRIVCLSRGLCLGVTTNFDNLRKIRPRNRKRLPIDGQAGTQRRRHSAIICSTEDTLNVVTADGTEVRVDFILGDIEGTGKAGARGAEVATPSVPEDTVPTTVTYTMSALAGDR